LTNIMEQLQSGNPEDKVCGCQGIGNLSNSKLILDLIIQKKIVRVIGPLLLEGDHMVRLAAAGALRNVSGLDPDTAEELVKQDMMTPLEQYFTKAASTAIDQLTAGDIEVLSEAVNLLWNLVEASATAFRLFTSSELLGFIVSLLSHPQQHNPLVLAVLNLLASACDQNRLTSEKVMSQMSAVESVLLNSTNNVLRISAALLIATVLEDKILEYPNFAQLMEVIATLIKLDTRELVSNLSSSAPVSANTDEEMEVEGAEDNRKFRELSDHLISQQTSLEILTNLATLGGSGESEDWEDAADTDDEENMSNAADDEADDMHGEEADPTAVSPLLLEAVAGLGLVPAVLERANPLPDNVKDILNNSRQGKKIVKQYENVRERTFLCLSNLVDALSVDELGGAAALFKTWNGLGTVIVQAKDDKLVESSSACMRAVTSKLTSQGPKVMNLTEKELEALVQVSQSSQVAEVRMNMVHIVGDIATMLAKSIQDPGSVVVFRVLVGWLVDGGCKDTDIRVVAESLDKLFDAFSEDDTDAVFFALDLLPKFRGILNSMKIKISTQKRDLGSEALGPVNMAKLNLNRFIKYKEKRARK